MKLALFSDIHGNAPALEAVLEDLKKQPADFLICAGDLVGYGAFPNQVIEKFRALMIPVVMGNYDQGVGYDLDDCGCAYQTPDAKALGQRSLEWTKKMVLPENKEYLRGLPDRFSFKIHGKKVMITHGSPRRINEYLFIDRPAASINRILDDEDIDLLICGHTHLPYIREFNQKFLINTGSVGKPKDGDTRSGYVLVEITESNVQAEFRRVVYDLDQAAGAITKAGLPHEFAQALLEGR